MLRHLDGIASFVGIAMRRLRRTGSKERIGVVPDAGDRRAAVPLEIAGLVLAVVLERFVNIRNVRNGAVLSGHGKLERTDLVDTRTGFKIDVKQDVAILHFALRLNDQVDLAALCRACHDDQRQHHGNSE